MIHKNWRRFAGVERHMFDVKEWLESLGHRVLPFSMQDDNNEPAVTEEYYVSPIDMRANAGREKLRAARRSLIGDDSRRHLRLLLQEHRIDAAYVGHVYHQIGSTCLPLLAANGIPAILTLHDYKLGCPNYRLYNETTRAACTLCIDHKTGYLYGPAVTKCAGGARSAALLLSAEAAISRLGRTYQRGVRLVTVINDVQRRAAIAHGIPAQNIRLIPHFVELPPAKPRRSIREGPILYVGRLAPEKGVDLLIDACSASGLPLVVVGDGRDRPRLEDLARAKESRIDFLGWCTEEEIYREMQKARALVVPSIWPEVWGLVINDAIASGLPVIASNTGGLADILAEGRGALFPPGDVAALTRALRALSRHPERGSAMTDAAWQYAKAHLSREMWQMRLASVFEEIGRPLA